MASSPTRCRGSRIFLLSLRRLRLRVAAQASRTSHRDVSAPPDVEASRITACRGKRVSFCRPHFLYLLLERLPRRYCQVVSSISKLTFKVALPPSCCKGNVHSFFMTLFTSRGRHHSSSRGRGAWDQRCHVEQLRLQPSWDIFLLALTAPLGFSVLRLSLRSPAVAEERASFLDRRHIARFQARASMATGFFASTFFCGRSVSYGIYDDVNGSAHYTGYKPNDVCRQE